VAELNTRWAKKVAIKSRILLTQLSVTEGPAPVPPSVAQVMEETKEKIDEIEGKQATTKF
jgi:hypothetical protein